MTDNAYASESEYEQYVRLRLMEWERRLLKPPGLLERTSRTIQTKINERIPAKVHQTITATVRGIFRTVLFTLDFVPQSLPQTGLTLRQRDERAQALTSTWKKIAAAEGAGTGAGGILLGLADFPALIAIKMKFLFELAHLYGFSTLDYRERLFLLHVFQLAFSSVEHKARILTTVKRWDDCALAYPAGDDALKTIDWEKLQQEYRDTIDFRKLLQLVPGIGAIVGAWVNFSLLEELGETGIQSFRMRLLSGSG